MNESNAWPQRWTRLEPRLAVAMVLLKLYFLGYVWGRAQGFDVGQWFHMFRGTQWFRALPSPRSGISNYHPPGSHLLGRLVYAIYPHPVEASQILSTLSLLVAFFALRSTLRRIGWLTTLPGLWLLYGGMSLPLMVWLAAETGYDPPALGWFMLALPVSTALFWGPTPPVRRCRAAFASRLALLVLVFAGGLFNKFTALLAFSIPFLIILIRRGLRAWFRELWAPATAAVLAVLLVLPLYYNRYYKTEGTWMPAAMEWLRPHDLKVARAARDAAPWRFVRNMLRIPQQPVAGAGQPVVDSFYHSVWLHTWKFDTAMGPQAPLGVPVSDGYVRAFAYVLPVGTVLFLLRQRHLPSSWRHLGWLLLAIAALFTASALSFAWQYPLWDWRVFKAKYLSPALLWVPYATAVVFADRGLGALETRTARWIQRAGLSLVLAFMCVNHLLPVYCQQRSEGRRWSPGWTDSRELDRDTHPRPPAEWPKSVGAEQRPMRVAVSSASDPR
jgi:hypothetical protein